MKVKKILENDMELEFPHIYAIDASAGAGKTSCLTERYLQFILSSKIKNANYRHLCAITFTNRAAKEMKTRIINTLKKIALGDKQETDKILKLIQSNETTVIQKSGDLLDKILRNYSDLNISTIDSFINSIIRASTIEAGVSPDFDVTVQPEGTVEYALDTLLEEIESSPELKVDFDNFIHSYLNMEERASWYARNVLLEKVNMLRQKENEKGTNIRIIERNKPSIDDVINIARDFLEESKECGLNFDRRAQVALESFIAEQNSDSKFLLKKNATELFKKGTKIPQKLERLWKKFTSTLSQYYENKAISIYHPYLVIHRKVEKKLDDIKYEKGLVFIDELNAKVRRLIENYEVPYIYYKLGEEIRHYLIDEFQDTNEIQWKNIMNLVQNSLSEGGSLFYVGDKKQAIYRFRGGKAELFDEVLNEKELTQIARVYQKTIEVNYRSAKNIIDFNNRFFSVENLSLIGSGLKSQSTKEIFSKMLHSTYSKSRQKPPESGIRTSNEGYIYTKRIKFDDEKPLTTEEIDEVIKEQLFKDLKNVMERMASADIAILVRKREEVKKITNWFLEKGLPVVSESAGDLREQPLIREIVSFLKFLNDPLDELAFIGFISGEIFTTLTGINRTKIYDWLNRIDLKNVILYKKFQEDFKNEWESYIEYFFKVAGFVPPYDIIIQLIDRLKVFQNFKNFGGFIVQLLETVLKIEEEGKNSIDLILQEWEKNDNPELFTVPMNVKSGAVNIMTLHKAKGLEFSVVFIPFAEIKPQPENEIFLSETNELAYAKKEFREKSEKLNSIFGIEEAKALIDEINVFYVGCTRAKDELYIYATDKRYQNDEFNLLANTFPFNTHEEFASGKQVRRVKEPERTSGKPDIKIFSYPVREGWENRFHGLKSKTAVINSMILNEMPAIKTGNLVHNVLSSIINSGTSDITSIVNRVCAGESEELKGEVENKVKKVIFSNPLRDYFLPDQNTIVHTEIDIIDEKGDTKRIDRLMLGKTENIIIDFKTGSKENLNRDKQQVREYLRLIKQIYPHRKTKGILVYIEPLEVIEVGDEK